MAVKVLQHFWKKGVLFLGSLVSVDGLVFIRRMPFFGSEKTF